MSEEPAVSGLFCTKENIQQKPHWLATQCRSNPRVYTFWTYWRNRYQRDDGLRLDHLLLSKTLKPKLVNGGVDADVRGEEGANDHAPVWIKLKRP